MLMTASQRSGRTGDGQALGKGEVAQVDAAVGVGAGGADVPRLGGRAGALPQLGAHLRERPVGEACRDNVAGPRHGAHARGGEQEAPGGDQDGLQHVAGEGAHVPPLAERRVARAVLAEGVDGVGEDLPVLGRPGVQVFRVHVATLA